MKKNWKSVDLRLITQLSLSLIVLIMGIIVMIFKAFGLTDIILYVSLLFYIYAFFSTLMYFIKRKEGDYELLLLSLINILVATYMFIFQKDTLPMILGSALTIYTILIVANRGYKIVTLKSEDNYMWVVKFIMTFLIAFIGALTTINLFNETTVQTLMIGYYFVSTGILMTIESIIEISITNTMFNKIMSKVINDPGIELENIEVVKEEIQDTEENKKTEVKPKTTKTVTKTKSSSKVNAVKKETNNKKPQNQKKESSSKKTTNKTEEKATKKVTTNKKENALKETKNKEIKIVKKAKPTKPKVEKVKEAKVVAVPTKKTVITKTTSKKSDTKKVLTKPKENKQTTVVKKVGRPKKVSSNK